MMSSLKKPLSMLGAGGFRGSSLLRAPSALGTNTRFNRHAVVMNATVADRESSPPKVEEKSQNMSSSQSKVYDLHFDEMFDGIEDKSLNKVPPLNLLIPEIFLELRKTIKNRTKLMTDHQERLKEIITE